MSSHVFISFASRDLATAERICDLLEQRQVPCWISSRHIEPGAEYPDELIRAIESCRACVLLLSEHANESKYIKLEIERAVSKGKPIFPVRLREVEPSDSLELFVSSAQWIEAWSPPLEAKMDRLAAALRQLDEPAGDVRPARLAPPVLDQLPRPSLRAWAALAGGSATILLIVVTLALLWSSGEDQETSPSPGIEVGDSAIGDATGLSPAIVRPLDLAYRTLRDGPPPQAAMDVWVQCEGDPSDLWNVLECGGRVASGQRYQIAIHSRMSSWFYVFQIDSTGHLDWLFPRNGSPYSYGSNPVVPGSWVQIPGGDKALQLDDNVGIEHIYAVATSARWDELEVALERARREGSDGAPVASHLDLQTRGVAGVVNVERPAPVTGDKGANVTKLIQGVDGVLVREVWFHHVVP